MSKIVAQVRCKNLLAATAANDWPAVWAEVSSVDELVRKELLEWNMRAILGDTDKFPALCKKFHLEKAKSYLEEIDDPALAVKAALLVLGM